MSIYVARIPPECDERQLKEIFEGVGPVKVVSLKSSKGDHKTNYAFVDFVNDEDAACAVQYMNNYKVGEYKLLVNIKKKESTSGGYEPSANGFGGFKLPAGRSAFNSSTSTRGRGGFGNFRGNLLKRTESSTENGDSSCQKSYNWPGISMDENEWDDECDSTGNNTKLAVSQEEESAFEEKVLVVHVEHPSKFWGQPVSQKNAEELGLIASELARECKSAMKISDQFLPGKVYGSKFSVDQQWYRCKVEKQLLEKEIPLVKVRYIDYGNDEIVETSSLVELPISLQQKPPCAKEYKMDIVPINEDESSDQFKQGVDQLQHLLHEQVVNISTSNGINPSVKVTMTSSNKNVADEMNAAGVTVASSTRKIERFSIGPVSKPLQSLRSPRNIASPSTNTVSEQRFSKDLEQTEAKTASLLSELEQSRKLTEKLKTEIQLLKQKKTILEQSLETADSKLKEISSSVVHAKFWKLVDEVSSLKNLRRGIDFEKIWSPVLKNAVAALTDSGKSIKLKSLASFSQLLDAETLLSSNQNAIKCCSNKDEVSVLIGKRDESKKDYFDMLNLFISDVEHLNFEPREQELKMLLDDIEEKYKIPIKSHSWNRSVLDAVEAYEIWKGMKIQSIKELQRSADVCSSLLTNSLERFTQNICIKGDAEDYNVECQNIDDLIENYSKVVADEMKAMKEANIAKENQDMLSDIISSIVHSIYEELSGIGTLREKGIEYKKKKGDIEAWITCKPDISKLKRTRMELKNMKSKFRHKQADLRDLEEDSEEDEKLQTIESEIKVLRNELHRLFIEEIKLLGELSQIAENHFPELIKLFPDLGISSYLESNGILHTRELEYYDHHFLPLISSASSQPLVFKTQFNQEDCVLKEYSLCPQLSKEIFKSRVFKFTKCKHPNFVTFDSLFFDKADRKAYLQHPFYGDGDFKDFIETKPDAKDLTDAFHCLLQAIETLHSNGCVHGGIAAGNILITKVNNDSIPILTEPNFSKDENQRFEDLKDLYPILKSRSESLSMELDMFCFGLLMFSAYFPDQTFNTDAIEDTKENSIFHVMKSLLQDSVSDRMTASDASRHPVFQRKDELECVLDELLRTDGDASDSFAIVELNVSSEYTELNDITTSNDGKERLENEAENIELQPKESNGELEVDVDGSTKWSVEE